ncbi:vancomycin resistance protein [Paenibacillus swuensis]|uniref:Vancomycin resistance protein n=1 Tax=Paenibacillus swuensis TaxID=1178515 RepID=A0A172TF69_9BACL|nr:VanW family protein [Paenibacillus swuensis]ANE45602.1 vancomycin resistance protein [Paenibacillus swuensis]
MQATLKPVRRSIWRIRLGKIYFTFRRWLHWYFGGKSYVRAPEKLAARQPLPHTVYEHRTPTLRKLKDVDMWLQHNKVINLKLALQQLNGVNIQPGETFSYWKMIGRPSRAKGYVDGMVLFYGSFKPGVGGGLCQLSNMIYWMTLHTPLTVTERHRHSYDVFPDAGRTQPFGSGATCAYNYLDLQIRNDTGMPYRLNLSIVNDELRGQWSTAEPPLHTYEIYEKDHSIKLEHWGGYTRHNTLYRKMFNLAGEQVDDQYITENHAVMMYQPLLKEEATKP